MSLLQGSRIYDDSGDQEKTTSTSTIGTAAAIDTNNGQTEVQRDCDRAGRTLRPTRVNSAGRVRPRYYRKSYMFKYYSKQALIEESVTPSIGASIEDHQPHCSNDSVPMDMQVDTSSYAQEKQRTPNVSVNEQTMTSANGSDDDDDDIECSETESQEHSGCGLQFSNTQSTSCEHDTTDNDSLLKYLSLLDFCDESESDTKVLNEEKWKELLKESTGETFDDKSDDEYWEDRDTDLKSNVPTKDQPIYPGHSLTLEHSLLLILVYSITHSITGTQLQDLLTLISLHLMSVHPAYKSIVRFKQYFSNMNSGLVKHYYCSSCLSRCQENTAVCHNTVCSKTLTSKNAKSYFIELPIDEQLRKLFQRSDFASLLQHRFKRRKKGAENYEDIYDGQVYKTLSQPGGPLSSQFPYNVSFTWNTDGVPIFKSSKFSIWPMYLMINELPFNQRKMKENLILSGLWFGDTKPLITTFANPTFEKLKLLEEKGIEVTVNNCSVRCQAFLICGTADLPAKSMAMNFVQFNAGYSCPKCLQRGETVFTRVDRRGHVHAYPYKDENPLGDERQAVDCWKLARDALKNRAAVNSIKGPTFLMRLKSYDYIRSTSIDYMHCVLLGVTKLLLTLWFSSSHSGQMFSLSSHVDLVDNRLSKIQPTYNITRLPRSISEHLKYWKASELRSWLFFYSLPILFDIMSDYNFYHYSTFVEAVWLLCQDSVSEDDLNQSQKLINYFVYMFEPLYGARYLTLNLHSLLHLPKCVKDLGPLWAYSCFPFEDANGELLKLFHGTQAIDIQIISSVNVVQMLPYAIESVPTESHAGAVLQKLKKKERLKLTSQLDFDIFALGKAYSKVLPVSQYEQVISILGKIPDNLVFFNRIKLRNQVMYSKDYKRVNAGNSYTVKYIGRADSNIYFGHVEYFAVETPPCKCTTVTCICKGKIFVFISRLKRATTKSLVINSEKNPNQMNVKLKHIHEIKGKTNIVDVISIRNILSLCIEVSFDDEKTCVCEFPNFFETD